MYGIALKQALVIYVVLLAIGGAVAGLGLI